MKVEVKHRVERHPGFPSLWINHVSNSIAIMFEVDRGVIISPGKTSGSIIGDRVSEEWCEDSSPFEGSIELKNGV